VIDRGKRNLIGVSVNAIDYEAAVSKILAAATDLRPLTVSALAVHGVMTGALDSTHRFRLNALDLVVPDGQPVRWALNLLHSAGLADRVYGPTLMIKVCEAAAAHGLPIFLYGSRVQVLDRLRDNLQRRVPNLVIAGMEPSRFRQLSASEQQETAARIRETGARIVFVGLGCPRQEVWLYEQRELLPIPLLAVGAAFDFHAGILPQAPTHLQRAGLEWAFRLACEPRRLWRRYLYLNPLYVAMFVLQYLKFSRFDVHTAKEPSGQLRFG
jgi:N-acetylglucosaminyldiphosphoundecaprenol N-acetyl-beta-D-mannosaminyltransferase